MPNNPISNLTPAAALTGAEFFPVVQSSSTKKGVLSALLTYIKNNITFQDTLSAGSTLTQTNVVLGAGFGFQIKDVSEFNARADNIANVEVNYMSVAPTSAGLYYSHTGVNNYSGVEALASYGGFYVGKGVLLSYVRGFIANQTIANNGVNNTLIVDDGINSKGLVYAADYSVNMTLESLASVRKVNSLISNSAANYLPLIGGTLTGNLILNADPTTSLQAASKNYVDQLINGLSWKKSARASTTAALPTYVVSGGNTILTGSVNGALTAQDTIALALNDRLLVKNETGSLAINNGGYVVTDLGSATTPWVLTRVPDANTSATLLAATWFVREGATELNRVYSINVSPITLGTTNITFSLIAGAGTYVNGTGLALTGNVFSIASTYVGQASITTLGTVTTGTWNASLINPTYGGTGVNNGASTITLAGSVTHAGAFTRSFTATANTTLTLPTTGTLATLAGVETLTNKRRTRRVIVTTQSATPAINTDVTDVSSITGLAQAITSFTSGLTGTPVDGDLLEIRITDNGTARAITWGASFESSGTVTLPTTTVASTLLRIGFEWNTVTTKWSCIAVA